GIGLRRQLAEPGGEISARSRPQLDRGFRAACFCEPCLWQRDNGFLLTAMGKPNHRLADGNHLARLRKRCRDYTVGIGLEVGIVELVVRKVERALGTLEASFGLVLRRLLAIEIGGRGPATRLQRSIAFEV